MEQKKPLTAGGFREKSRKILSGIGGKNCRLEFFHWDTIQNNEIGFIIPLCPLYAHGNIDDSILIEDPESVYESRVGVKWKFVESFVETLTSNEVFQSVKKTIHFLLADQGIITRQENIPEIIAKHSRVYVSAIEKLKERNPDIYFDFMTFSSLGAKLPQTLDMSLTLESSFDETENEKLFVKHLKKHLQVDNICYGRKHKKTIQRAIKAFGMNLGVQLLASYLSPDEQFKTLATSYKTAVIVNIERSGSVLLDFPFFDLHQWQASEAVTIAVNLR